jgi:hypothetical protein
MSRSANRAKLRKARQQIRWGLLTPEERKANPSAAQNYVIFGGEYSDHIITMAEKKKSRRERRAEENSAGRRRAATVSQRSGDSSHAIKGMGLTALLAVMSFMGGAGGMLRRKGVQ